MEMLDFFFVWPSKCLMCSQAVALYRVGGEENEKLKEHKKKTNESTLPRSS